MQNPQNPAIQIYSNSLEKPQDLNLSALPKEYALHLSGNSVMLRKDKIETPPLIFTKKVNTAYKTIPHKSVKTELGESRYYPAASKEWFNSVYAYNNNYIKNLPVLDKNLKRFMESYFNNVLRKAQFTRKNQPNRLFPLRLSSRVKRLHRLSLNKIFLAKAELKHSSDKVTITLFVFNQEKITLNRRLKAYLTNIFPSSKLLKRVILPLNKLPEKKELALASLPDQQNNASAEDVNINEIKPLSLKKNLLLFHSQIHLQANKININSNFPWLTSGTMPKSSQVDKKPFSIESYPSIDTRTPKTVQSFFWKNLNLEWEALMETTKKLSFNHLKFDQSYLLKIKPLISKLYNKKVEFNIINLKQIHLHTDIFTQVIANKLKDRDNRLLVVLKSALSLVKLPKVNKMELKYGKDNTANMWFNKVKNLTVYPDILSLSPLPSSLKSHSGFNADLVKEPESGLASQANLDLGQSADLLNKLLKGSVQPSELCKAGYNNNLINSALHSIKHKINTGVRLEARGRLTRRFTASRSVFKLKWKGGLNNIDARYKGLSSVILRGHARNNVQYSLINSKNRNGAFGVRGWTSSI